MNHFDFDKIPKFGFVYFESDTLVFLEDYRISKGQIICEHAEDLLNLDYRNVDFFNYQKDVRYKCCGNAESFELEFSDNDRQEKDPLLHLEEDLVLEKKYRFKEFSRIKIVNRFYFDNNNVIHLKDYRLVTLLHEK